MTRLDVRKTYKLYIGGEFPRSESGRVFPALDSRGELVARVAQASRKDLRDAVRHARQSQPAWAGRSGYNRGQIVYRIAELIEDRLETFAAQVQVGDPDRRRARRQVEEAIDTLVWYAGWADKFAQIYGNLNPVAGPFFNISAPEPTGVVGLVASQDSPLLGLVSRLAPILITGNTVVVISSQAQPLPAATLAEVLETSDVPAGVVNILTGYTDELVPWLADHMDVNALDASGANPEQRRRIDEGAVHNVKRVVGGDPTQRSPFVIAAFTETKTVWHPKGL
ncbi:MAG TPA: aldehyde dehydrogenase family protein [Acidimicrobiia bacterium]|nr:aldehyde dehydrogenase family protein [Acidimicrobiia bacterium]